MTADAFVAIDFETADHQPDSACAIGVVRVEGGEIVARVHHLIRPPRREIVFTYIHGIAWADVHDQPDFAATWRKVEPLLEGVAFIAAHNAGFDKSVLHACCGSAGLAPPRAPFKCTVTLSRRVWGIYPTKLPDVCDELGIELRHHEALSDAEACARIVMAAQREGWQHA